MSFSAEVKKELCIANPSACCLKAEVFGMLIFGRSFSLREISLMTEQECIAERCVSSIRELTGIVPALSCSKAGKYKLDIKTAADREKLLSYFGYTGKELSLRINYANFENNSKTDEGETDDTCCFRSFLRGAFLVCGSVNDPEKNYHIEFNVTKYKLCTDLISVINEVGLKAKILMRSNNCVAYAKDAQAVEEFIGTLGANNAFIYLMKTRAMKDIKNHINRKMNFESANLNRSIDAGIRQTELINSILSVITPDDMTEDLALLCRLRLDNPDASLDELGKMMEPPLSRSAVSRRFKKLEAIAAELQI